MLPLSTAVFPIPSADETRKLKAIQYSKEYAKRCRKKGVCVTCGSKPPRDGSSRCSSCLEGCASRARDKIARLRSEGLCTRCGKCPPYKDGQTCRECRVKDTAGAHGLTAARYLDLIDAGCVICGKKENLHIDHDHSCCPAKTRKGCGNCVRGALCSEHNLAVGHLEREDAMEVISYLLATSSDSPLIKQFKDPLA